MGKDKQRFIVILDGRIEFVPVRETFRIIGKRRAMKLARKLKKRKDIKDKRIKIVKDGVAKEVMEEFMFRGLT